MKTKLIYAMGCMIITSPIYSIPSYVGDLVARDLIGAGPLGHVGIASAPDFRTRPTVVLEAMNSAPHIQQNYISDFKSRSKYWGSKGGLLSPQSIESYTVANRIVRQYYACPEYTLTWIWREGRIDEYTNPISCGQFRCDTLVNYAYAFSTGYSLPTYDTTWTTPVAVFNYFPVFSDLLIPERYRNQENSLPPAVTSETINSIDENTIKELDDEKFYQILQNSPNISNEQLSNLWALFLVNEVDEKVKILFYDFLSFQNPDYLTSEIIKQAKKENGEPKHKLLVTLQSIYQKGLEKNDKTRLKEIISYFKELQHQDLDKNDGGIVYRALATLTSINLETKTANLINMDKIHVNILNIKNDRSHEMEYVKNIISNLEAPDDNLVVTASYKYITQLLINTELKFLTSESKQLFIIHLENTKMINRTQSILFTPAYIEFKAALNATTLEEIPYLTKDYVKLLDPSIQEATFYGFTDFTKNKLQI